MAHTGLKFWAFQHWIDQGTAHTHPPVYLLRLLGRSVCAVVLQQIDAAIDEKLRSARESQSCTAARC